MRIAVNTRLLIKDKLEGIGWFSYEVLKRLSVNHPQHEFIFIFDRAYSEEFIFSSNVTPVVTGPPARHVFLYYLWFEFSVPKILKKYKADVFFSPDGYLSLRTNVQQVQVIHDLAFLKFPEHIPFLERKYYNRFFPRFAQKAASIITVSEFSKSDIVEQYGIDANKIDVVYNGMSALYVQLSDPEKQVVRDIYSNGFQYFIYVGSINPRKNIGRLLEAFDLFCESADCNTKLLIVGEKMWPDSHLAAVFESMKNKERVVFTGRLKQEDLVKVMASALALTYVSLFEGFGIPIIEAMQCDVPVITSNVSSMPEVSADAALLVDPNSVDSIKKAMLQIATDGELRANLINKGNFQSQLFSWDKTAEDIGRILFGK
jgi:glycosyltransferase involved in cell wall biosynthesis